jgi:hypothetical protein
MHLSIPAHISQKTQPSTVIEIRLLMLFNEIIWESYEISKYTVWLSTELFNVRWGGTYIYHEILKV